MEQEKKDQTVNVSNQDVLVPAPIESELSFKTFNPIDFSPSYFEYIMKTYGGDSSRRKNLRGDKTGDPSKLPKQITPLQIFALEAAEQFGAQFPNNSYKELKDGTSTFSPGVPLTDESIVKILTTMEDKGFLQAATRRFVENLPSATGFAAGAVGTKKFVDQFLPSTAGMRTGLPGKAGKALDFGLRVYEGARTVAPVIGGVAGSFLSSNFAEPFGEFVLGEEGLPTPDSYSKMRAAEGFADVISFAPLMYGADKIAVNGLTDYFANRLNLKALDDLGNEMLQRPFDFEGKFLSMGQQIKQAERKANPAMFDPQNIPRGQRPKGEGRRFVAGKPFQGPVTVNDLNERGVASVLQGRVPPPVLRRLLVLENALKRSGQEARDNKKITAFYEMIAAGGAAVGVGQLAESDPFGTSEILGELGFSFAAPILLRDGIALFVSRLGKPYGELRQEQKDLGIISGTKFFVKDRVANARAKKGFQIILRELDAFGSLDDPAQLEDLIFKLNANATKDGISQTAGQATKDPVLLSIEEALSTQFSDLGEAKAQAIQGELDTANRLLEALYRNKNADWGREALRVAAEVKEALFETAIDFRLQNAENALLKSVQQVKRSNLRNVQDIRAKDDRLLKSKIEGGLAALNEEDMIDLSERLSDLLSAQKLAGRGRQKALYRRVGDLDVSFFDDEGAITTVPKFARFLESENVEEGSEVYKQLSSLFKYADEVKKKLHNNPIRPQVTSTVRKDGGDLKTIELSDDHVPDLSISLESLRSRRTDALGIARDGTKNDQVRRIAGMFAEAIQDDIENFTNFGSDDINVNQLRALQEANAYSRAFSNVFLKGYVGEALEQSKKGEFRFAPETIGETLRQVRFDPNSRRILQIQKAGEFLVENNIQGATDSVASVNGTLDRILRTAYQEAFNTKTGKVNEEKLYQFLERNKRIFKTFPALEQDLRSLEMAQAILSQENVMSGIKRSNAEKQVGFTSLLRDAKGQVIENPTIAVQQALTGGADQFTKLKKLIDIIPKKGDKTRKQIFVISEPETGFEMKFFNKKDAKAYVDRANQLGKSPDLKIRTVNLNVDRDMAIEGFKSAIFEHLVSGAETFRRNKSVIRPDVIEYNLFNAKFPIPRTARQKTRTGERSTTLAEFLKNQGVLSNRDLESMQTALNDLKLAQSPEAVSILTEDLEQARPLLDFGVAITGSAIGTRSQALLTGGQGGPGSIIAAGKGADALRNIVLRIPESQKMLFTAELLQNPEALARMLRRYGEGQNQVGLLKSISNYFTNKGFVVLPSRAFTATRERELPTVDEGGFNPLIQGSSPPSPPQAPPLPPPQALPPPPQQTAQGLPNPLLRARYAATFPNDPISAMLQQPPAPRPFARGGIASLMRT